LMEVKPTGTMGEKYVLTCMCVATRYPFFRAVTNREAPYLAQQMLDIFLDCGVIPAVIQSDNEFVNLAFEELCSLLGSNQIFSTALRPQSQGIIERVHRDMREYLAVLVDAYVRACPRKWPQYLRYVEHKVRHKSLVPGITPFAAVHGFAGSTALSTASGALEAIPEEVVWADWLRTLVSETKELNATLGEHWAAAAEYRARVHSEKKKLPDFQTGELVLLAKPFYEQGQGVILPQCDGPYVIRAFPSDHTVILADVLTGAPAFEGKPVSIARIIRFHYPAEWATLGMREVDPVGPISTLKVGQLVACSPKTSQFDRVHVARVERIFPHQEQCEVTLYHVPTDCRTGPWRARVWEIWLDPDGSSKREVISADELVCSVTLVEGALTEASLEALVIHGIPVDTQPRRDHTLPPRVPID
jgi:transposase InsO family protein